MELTVKERLIHFLKYKRLSQKKFEETVGLSNGYVNNIRRSITEDKLQKIVLRFPDLNKSWLLFGEGEMISGSDLSPVVEQEVRPYTTNGNGVKFFEQESGQLIMQAPVVQFDALGSMADDYAELVASRDEGEISSWEVDSVHQGKYFSFVVENDSMDDGSRDSFQKGDMVLVRELDRQDWQPHLYINKWRFWVVCFGNCIRIKEIVAQDEEAGTITLHSLNPSPEYTDFTLRLDEISRLFNVIQLQPKKRVF